jgi:hypothetical protein
MRTTPAIAAYLLLSACGGGGPAKPKEGAVEPGGDPAGATAASGGGEASGSGGGSAMVAAPPAGFAEADLVAIEDGALVTYKVAAGKVERLGSATLTDVDPEDYMSRLSGDWADRDHFFMQVPPRTVLQVTATAVTSMTVPPEAAFKTPRPKVEDDEGLTEGGEIEGRTGLVVTEGGAWWVECPWGFPYDGWQCEVWSMAKLWPTTEVKTDGAGIAARNWRWPDVTVKGIRLKEMEAEHALGCMPMKGTKQKPFVFRGSDEQGEEIESSHWVSVSPPRLLVVYGSPGLADLVPTRWSLHDGCLERPLAQGTAVEPGPGELWLAWEANDPLAEDVQPRQVIRRGAEVVGEVTGTVRFRPNP